MLNDSPFRTLMPAGVDVLIAFNVAVIVTGVDPMTIKEPLEEASRIISGWMSAHELELIVEKI